METHGPVLMKIMYIAKRAEFLLLYLVVTKKEWLRVDGCWLIKHQRLPLLVKTDLFTGWRGKSDGILDAFVLKHMPKKLRRITLAYDGKIP